MMAVCTRASHPPPTPCTFPAGRLPRALRAGAGRTMLFPSPADRAFAAAVSRLVYCNPFLPERITAEREALGAEFVEGDLVWNALRRVSDRTSNVAHLGERATAIADAARQRIALAGTA